MSLKDEIVGLALEHVDLVGVTPSESFDHEPPGLCPSSLLTGAKSVIVLGSQLNDSIISNVTTDDSAEGISFQVLLTDHQDTVRRILSEIAYRVGRLLTRAGYRWRHVGDQLDKRDLSGTMSNKHAAILAGLGVWGRHSMVLTPQFGPRQYFCSVVTDAEIDGLPVATPHAHPCTGCGLCIRECPAHAISQPPADRPYAIDRFRCAMYMSGAGGCNLCLARCPAGRRAL